MRWPTFQRGYRRGQEGEVHRAPGKTSGPVPCVYYLSPLQALVKYLYGTDFVESRGSVCGPCRGSVWTGPRV